MTDLSAIGEALVAAIETQLSAYSVEVVKGYPRWGEVDFVPPVVALTLDSHQHRKERVGGVFQDYSWFVTVYGGYEEEMWNMVEDLSDWISTTSKLTVGSDEVPMQLANADRQLNETEMEQEDHAFILNIVTQGI